MISRNAEGTWLRPELVAPWWEIAAILFAVMGQSIYSSTWLALHGSSRYPRPFFLSYHSMLSHIAWQGWYMAILLMILNWRGWKPADFKIRVNKESTLQGLVLTVLEHVSFAIGLAVIFFAMDLLRRLGQPEGIPVHVRAHLQVPTGPVYLFVRVFFEVLNSYREELCCMGYAFNEIASKRGPLIALILMVTLRLSYHTYQGVFPLFEHAIFFSIFGLWYWRTRNLWPLILTHTLFNLFPLRIYSVFSNLMGHL